MKVTDKFTFMQVLQEMRSQLIIHLYKSSPAFADLHRAADNRLKEDLEQVVFEYYLSKIGDNEGLTFNQFDAILIEATLEKVLENVS